MVKFLSTGDANGTYNGSDVGLGKTAMTVEALNRLGNPRTLVIAPSVVKLNWGDEIEKWWTGRDAEILYLDKSKELQYLHKHRDLVIVSYGLVRQKKVTEALAACKFDAIVLDEAHYVKNTESITTHCVLRTIWPTIPHRICLSATPFTHSIIDCYTTFSRLAPGTFGSYYEFADYFCEKEESIWGTKYVGVKNVDVLREIIRDKFFVRISADEAAIQLPEKQWTQIKLSNREYGVKLTAEEQEAHKKYLEELRQAFARDASYVPTPPKATATVRRQQAEKKVSAVIEFVKNLLDSGVKTIVYFQHLECIKKTVESLDGYSITVIDGSKSEEERYKSIGAFNSGERDCIILQIKAGGHGINLPRAEAVVFGEITYVPSDVEQCIGRARRSGNEHKNLFIYYFVTEGTIEEQIEEAVIERAKVFKQVLE